jgi:ubiquinone biosynthesis monooxygenase Coq7
LQTLAVKPSGGRAVPGSALPECELDDQQRRDVAALMRINHVGEICAQALYQGQAITARNRALRDSLQQAADEEVEHLAWTLQRIEEVGGRTSVLNPLWYGGALAIGVAAGVLGVRWNLGFLAETETQVEAHLQGHLSRIPAQDGRSRAILDQMKQDEAAHARLARDLGAAELPLPVRAAMKIASKFMTTVAARV